MLQVQKCYSMLHVPECYSVLKFQVLFFYKIRCVIPCYMFLGVILY